MSGLVRRALALAVTCAACVKPAHVDPVDDTHAPCASLDAPTCERARGLVAAARTYADEPHALLLVGAGAGSSPVPGRGVARTPSGDRALPDACALVRAPESAPRLDTRAIDYAFVGVAIDSTLVASDADVAPLLASGDHDAALVAIALVHDDARGAIVPGPAITATARGACACGGATHVVGETLFGASIAYRARAPRVDRPTRAIDVVRAALSDPDARVSETRAGALAVDGLSPYIAGRDARPLAFRVDRAEPVAYALRSVAEACPNALPAPLLTPSPIDFGVAAYGHESTRLVHVANRAKVDLDALVGARTVRVPAGGIVDLPLQWVPEGDAWRCEAQTREEAIHFVPADRDASVVPPEQIASVLEVVRTGRPWIARAERVEPTPTDKSGQPGQPGPREWSCLPDFAVTSCRVEHATGDARAETTPNGCRFSCRAGPPCAFDARMECALRCPE